MGSVVHNVPFGDPRTKPLFPAAEDLAEYREEADRGRPMVPSMLFDGLGSDPAPRQLDIDEANFVAGELQDLILGAKSVARATKGREPSDLHDWANSLVVAIEAKLVQLAGHGDAA